MGAFFVVDLICFCVRYMLMVVLVVSVRVVTVLQWFGVVSVGLGCCVMVLCLCGGRRCWSVVVSMVCLCLVVVLVVSCSGVMVVIMVIRWCVIFVWEGFYIVVVWVSVDGGVSKWY